MGGVALIKFTGGSDLLLVVAVGDEFVHVFSFIFQTRSAQCSSFRSILVPRCISMLVLFTSFWYAFFDNETCNDVS